VKERTRRRTRELGEKGREKREREIEDVYVSGYGAETEERERHELLDSLTISQALLKPP
jgi:hypothetical protein